MASTTCDEHGRNLAQLFRDRSAQYGSAVRWREKRDGEWQSATWFENQQLVNRVISGLDALGAAPGDRIGILSNTRWEWMVADWAIMGLGAVTVTLYPSNMPDMIATMLNDSGTRFLFAENQEQYEKLRSVRHRIPGVTRLILFEDSGACRTDAWVISFTELSQQSLRAPEEADAFAERRAQAIEPGDLASIVYTSGTTGEPKGVMLSHANLLAQIAGARSALTMLRPGLCDLLFLPLAHVLGREEHLVGTECGLETVVSGSLDHLADDIAEAKPGLLLSVPRVYEKAYAAILSTVASGSRLQRWVFQVSQSIGHRALRYRQDQLRLPFYLYWADALANHLVFQKIREALGGRLECAVTGGAPLDPEILAFFRSVGVPVLEGWGLTETGGAVSVNRADHYRLGSVGLIYPGHQIRVADDGELLLRGPCIFTGYYQMPQETAAAFDEEGWFRTGDIGMVDEQGFIHIVDRKKDLIATSGGKKIAPQRVENLLKTIPVVSQAAVFGDRKPYLVALLTLDPAATLQWAARTGLSPVSGPAPRDAGQIAEDPLFLHYLEAGVAEVNRHLARYETVKRFSIVKPDFTVENGLLTPTQKIRRREIFAQHHQEIERLYQPSDEPALV
jgi:long-chain acyl-CoA synthetase